MKEPSYTDLDKMPFGKHEGELMQDVPSHYLRWLRTNLEENSMYDLANLVFDPKKHSKIEMKLKVYNYIINNWGHIE